MTNARQVKIPVSKKMENALTLMVAIHADASLGMRRGMANAKVRHIQVLRHL